MMFNFRKKVITPKMFEKISVYKDGYVVMGDVDSSVESAITSQKIWEIDSKICRLEMQIFELQKQKRKLYDV